MIGYLFRSYLVVTTALTALLAVLAFFPGLFSDASIWEAVIPAMFWSSLATPFIVHREFKRRNLWPLYDNLRLSRYTVLGALTAAGVAVSVGLSIWL